MAGHYFPENLHLCLKGPMMRPLHVATIFGSLFAESSQTTMQYEEVHGSDDVVFSSCVVLHALLG